MQRALLGLQFFVVDEQPWRTTVDGATREHSRVLAQVVAEDVGIGRAFHEFCRHVMTHYRQNFIDVHDR